MKFSFEDSDDFRKWNFSYNATADLFFRLTSNWIELKFLSFTNSTQLLNNRDAIP